MSETTTNTSDACELAARLRVRRARRGAQARVRGAPAGVRALPGGGGVVRARARGGQAGDAGGGAVGAARRGALHAQLMHAAAQRKPRRGVLLAFPRKIVRAPGAVGGGDVRARRWRDRHQLVARQAGDAGGGAGGRRRRSRRRGASRSTRRSVPSRRQLAKVDGAGGEGQEQNADFGSRAATALGGERSGRKARWRRRSGGERPTRSTDQDRARDAVGQDDGAAASAASRRGDARRRRARPATGGAPRRRQAGRRRRRRA